jgi:hypothetical protein
VKVWERYVKKPSGHAWIEVNNEVQKFVLDNQDHPSNDGNPCQTKEIVRADA